MYHYVDEPVSWISRLVKALWAESSTGHRTGFFYFEIWHDIIFIQTALLLFQIQLPSLLQSILNNITPSLTCFRHSDLFLTHCLTTKQLYVIIWSWLYPRGNLLVCPLNTPDDFFLCCAIFWILFEASYFNTVCFTGHIGDGLQCKWVH